MKKIDKIVEIYRNNELKKLTIEQQEKWLRAKIVMQFVFLREKLGYTQQDIADKMIVARQQITRFENMNNSPTIFFLVKYALETKLDVILNKYLSSMISQRNCLFIPSLISCVNDL